MAVADASFSTSIDSMSDGLISAIGLVVLPPTAFWARLDAWMGIPSTIYKGSLDPLMEAVPRMRTKTPPPGDPEFVLTCTPEARPCKSWSELAEGTLAISPALTE